ncbi:hypothetical protein KBC55_01600 [Patescibacteria group bacterium]|nr:hypothetical protein [Patescibacteria group bacterium]
MHHTLFAAPILCSLYVDRNDSDSGFTAERIRERMIGLTDAKVSLVIAEVREVLSKFIDAGLVTGAGRNPDTKYRITTLGVVEAERTMKVMNKLDFVLKARETR